MSGVRRAGKNPYTRKQLPQQKTKTLADIKKPQIQAVRKQAAAQAANARSNQSLLSELLGGVHTQEKLDILRREGQRFATPAQRKQMEAMNQVFKKEGQALLEDYLGNVKSKTELESLRPMVEANGSAAQKALFAEWESYFQKPTWEKYANLHGATYTAPTSGVGKADRMAAEIIAKNEKHNELQKIYEQLFNQKAEGQLAEAERLKDLGLGTAKPTPSSGMTWKKYAEAHGTTYTPPTSGVGEADRRAAQIIARNELKDRIRQQLSGGSDYKAASEALINKPTPVAQRIEDLEAAFGAKVEHVKQVTSYTDKTIPPIGGGSVPPIGGGSVPPIGGGSVPPIGGGSVPPIGGGSVPPIGGGTVPPVSTENTSWVSKLFGSKAFKYGAIAVGIGFLAYGGYKLAQYLKNRNKAEETDTAQQAQQAQAQQAEQAQAQQGGQAAQKEITTQLPAEVAENQIGAEAVADSIRNNAPIDTDKFYVAKKGDCVWNIIKNDYLPKHPELAEEVKAQLTEKYNRVPTEDEIIAEVTKRVCHQNNINYFHAQPKPHVGDTVRFDRAA